LKVLDGDDGLLARFDKALDEASSPQDGIVYLPSQLSPRTKSQSRLELLALACKAALNANELGKNKGARWCEEVLAMDENNIDALVGKGERLMKEEKWEEATRTLERAFENGGRSSQDVSDNVGIVLTEDSEPGSEGAEAA